MNIEDAKAKFRAPPVPNEIDKMRGFIDRAIYDAADAGEEKLTVAVTCTKKLANVMLSHYTGLGFKTELRFLPTKPGKVVFVFSGWPDS